jgi:hypothetical protein
MEMFIREQNFLEDPAAIGIVRTPDALTDKAGYFTVRGLKAGGYFIEVNDAHGRASLLRYTIYAGDTGIVDLGTDTLLKAGVLLGSMAPNAGVTDTRTIVQIFGLDRIALVDPVSGTFGFDLLPAGTFKLRIVFSSPAVPPITIDSVIVPSGDTASVPFASWKYSKKLFLNTTASGAGVTSDVANFPVLVRLTGSNFNFGQAKSGGADIRFTKSDGMPLSYEIERWDSANGLAEIWVKVDTVYGNNSTQYIFMDWGNAAANATSDGATVFDTANGFQGIWHLSEPGNATAYDATINHYHGTPTGMTAASAVAGAIGLAQEFDGSSTGYIQMIGTANGKLNFPQHGTYSISAWVRLNAVNLVDTLFNCVVQKGDLQYSLQLGFKDKWQFCEYQDSLGWDNDTAQATLGAWQYLVGVRDGARQYLYLDGALVCDTIVFEPNASLDSSLYARNTGYDLGIGRSAATPDRGFNGAIDEVRAENVPLSADWILLCYANQKANDALVVFK